MYIHMQQYTSGSKYMAKAIAWKVALDPMGQGTLIQGGALEIVTGGCLICHKYWGWKTEIIFDAGCLYVYAPCVSVSPGD